MSVSSNPDQTQLWQKRLEEYLNGLGDRGLSNSLIDETSSVLKDWIGYTLSRGTDPATFDQARVDHQLDDRNPNLAEGSLRSYTGHIRRWCEHWQTQDTRSGQWHAPESPNRRHQHNDESEYWEERLEEYFEQLRDQGYEEPTINTKRFILRRWISQALARSADPGEFDQTQARHNLLEQGPDLSEDSLKGYLGHIRRWCEYLESLQDDETELWGERLEEYLEHLRSRGRSPGSINSIGTVVHRWIEHALKHDKNPEVLDPALVERHLYDQDVLEESLRNSHSSIIGQWCEYRQSRAEAPRTWLVRAGPNGEMERHNLNHSVITLGWDLDLTMDLEMFASRQELGELMNELGLTHWGTSARDQIWRFGREMQVDDFVVMPQKRPELDSRRVAIGRVQGPYEHDPSFGDGLSRRRAVEWLQTGISREVLAADLNSMLNGPQTIYGLRKRDAPYRIQYLAEHGIDPGDRNPSVKQDPPSVDELEMEDRLADAAERLYCKWEYLEELVGLLKDKGQIILYGPPGTGKTYLAQTLAEALAPEDETRSLVQFHPAYSYEDFFEGYRPVTDDDNQMTYELTPGPLARLAEHAADHPDQHVMVIDEINRANLPRVLGELLYLLEYRDKSIAVMHRPDDSFKLPKNIWFIGTMNTADRSIALIDAAMRRRFHFVPFFPEREPTASLLRKWTYKNAPDQAWVPALVSAVNSELERELGGDHLQLGPSHFMKPGLNEGGFERVWEYNIEPFIEDQLFGRTDKIKQFRLDAVLGRHGRGETAREADLTEDSKPTRTFEQIESLGPDGGESTAGGE